MKVNESPDAVCERYADFGAKLTIRSLDEQVVLIEGTALDLEFLGELLVAQARFLQDDGFEISPSGPGKTLFSSQSTLGIYLHRIER